MQELFVANDATRVIWYGSLKQLGDNIIVFVFDPIREKISDVKYLSTNQHQLPFDVHGFM